MYFIEQRKRHEKERGGERGEREGERKERERKEKEGGKREKIVCYVVQKNRLTQKSKFFSSLSFFSIFL